MSQITFEGIIFLVDDSCFLVNPEEWNMTWAKFVYQQEGIEELTDEHRRVINFLRQYYDEYKAAPFVQDLCAGVQLTQNDLYKLFPSGPVKGAYRMAGLPKPEWCV